MKLKITGLNNSFEYDNVESVRLPMESGWVGVLPGRSPFAGRVAGASLIYRSGGKDRKMRLSEGFAVVMPETVSVFAEAAEQ